MLSGRFLERIGFLLAQKRLQHLLVGADEQFRFAASASFQYLVPISSPHAIAEVILRAIGQREGRYMRHSII